MQANLVILNSKLKFLHLLPLGAVLHRKAAEPPPNPHLQLEEFFYEKCSIPHVIFSKHVFGHVVYFRPVLGAAHTQKLVKLLLKVDCDTLSLPRISRTK